MQLASQSQKNAADAKHYQALEEYYQSKIPDNTPGAVPAYTAEGINKFSPGGAGIGAAVPAEPVSQVGKWWTPERMRYAANYLEKNAGLSPYGASGLVARWAGVESKDEGPTSVNPKSGAYGIGQWLGDRLPGIKGVADFDKQLAYAANELQTREKGAADVLRNAKNEQDAARGASMFERAEGYDEKTGLDKFTSLTPVGHAYKTIYGNVPKAASGGMIHHYADGGAVEQKPYYAADLMDDVGAALGKVGDAVRGGFQAMSDMFGLHERPAVANADPNYMKRVEDFMRAPGAPPEQIQEVRSAVDPENKLGEALGTTYGLVKSYEFHRANGNQAAANKAAADILFYTRMKSQQLGALAVHAMQEGDQSTASKAIQQAYNFLPNAQKLEMRDGKAILVDQKTGDVVREVDFTPATLLKAAYGFSNGDAFLNDLQGLVGSEKEKIANIKAQSAVDVAGINAEAKTDAAGINVAGRKDVAQTQADAKIKVADIGADSREKVADTNANAHLQGIDKQQEGASSRNSADNQRALDVANINQGGANYRADKASETSLANNQNTNTTNERIAGIKDAGATERNTATNQTRAAIAAGNNDTSRANTQDKIDATAANKALDIDAKRQTTIDILDAKKSEGAANRASKEGIAAGNNATTLAATDKKVEGAGQRNSATNQTRADIAAGNNATTLAATEKKVEGANQRNVNTNETRRDINANNTATSRANTKDKIDATAANAAIKLDAEKAKASAANAESDRRVGRKAALTRQGSQLTRIDKMTDHALLGVDEMTTPTVSTSQAQATRNIARGIVEAGGGVAGDEAAGYARQITKWDKAAGRPVTKVKLNQSPDGYSVTMPDGVTLPLSESAFKEIARIHGGK